MFQSPLFRFFLINFESGGPQNCSDVLIPAPYGRASGSAGRL